MGLLKKLFHWKKNQEEPVYEIEDWEEVVYDRDDLQIDNQEQRAEYVKGCLEQIAEASKELENLQYEYNMVTSYLRDMEEIEALPKEEKDLLKNYARKLNALEESQTDFQERKSRMEDMQFRKMERMESEVQEGCEKLKQAEEYQDAVKRDLRKLDGERQAYAFRKNELYRIIDDSRSMAVVCTVAAAICILFLFVLQFGFNMNARMGYLAAAAFGAVAITVIFLRHNGAVNELSQVESDTGRIIQLQNTVKIRYVNNTHLLDYLYLKYGVSSAAELSKAFEQYQKEKEEREKFFKAERELNECQRDFLHELRRFQIQDPTVWLRQTAAILDKREMVEVRHNLIVRRQSLRRRMDYNKEVIAGKAQDEIKDLVEKYPKYAGEIMEAVKEYEKDFS